MAQQAQILKPQILNLDKSPKYLSENESFYLINNEVSINPNGGANNGASLGKSTPTPANEPACEIEQPAGENYTVLKYHSIRTNETYSGVYNSNGVHYIQRINGDGKCEIVYHGDCLKLSAAPRHSVEQWRGHMRIEKVCPNRDGKYFQWVDGDGTNGYIDTEASIATNFFTTPFFQICNDPCAYINLCVPQPCGCLNADFVPLAVGDEGLTNNILEKGIKLMFQHVYYDGRRSEWSDRSSLYFLDAKKCFFEGIGASRCLKFRLPVGNPMVEKIIVAFSDDGGINWYEYETIEKYKKYNSLQDKWYNRQFSERITSPDVHFSTTDCAFDYFFCNDKEKKSIAPDIVSRVRNPYPRNTNYIFAIGDSVAYGNYEDGNCPIDETEVEKFNIDVDCPNANCSTLYATVTVRAVIHSIAGNNGFVYRLGNEELQDDVTERAYFGGAWRFDQGNIQTITTFDQEFRSTTRNFIPYIEGTDYWGEMKQWKSDAYFQNTIEWGTVRNMGDQAERNRWGYFIQGGEGTAGLTPGGFFYQEYKFKVPKGTRGFLRLVSHEATDGKEASQNTSPRVIGILNSLTQYHGWANARSISDLSRAEIYFDTCDGDTDLGGQAFVIADIALEDATAYNGYIKDSLGLPVEGAIVKTDTTVAQHRATKTDHNGFYWMINYANNVINPPSVTIKILVELSCAAFSSVQDFSLPQVPLTAIPHNEQIRDSTYSNGSHAIIRMRVISCLGNRIAGLVVAISGSKARITDNNGYVTFKIRNYETRNRSVRLVVMDSNGCFTLDCNGNCNPCAPEITNTTQSCYFLSPPTFNLPPQTVNVDSILTEVGLKSGGIYDFGFVVEGDCGRLSAVNKIRTINIPSTQDKDKLSFCDLSYDATGITLPDWGKCLKIVRSENNKPFELQWVVDKIQRDANGGIRLTIQSLIDYNENFFFKTNTIYQWLKGDRIEFIRNGGNGAIFTTLDYGNLNYLTVSPFRDITIGNTTTTDADYFNQLIIIDDGRLADLKEGAVIELQRERQGTVQSIYKEICVDIPIINGKLLNETGTFSTFDTYLVARKAANVYGVFEHHSPSDFWGTRLDDTGKVHFQNQYENERKYGRNVTIASPTQVNFFGNLVKKFDADEQGDIMAINIVDDNIIMGISENDSFLAQAGNDLLTVGRDGIVRAVPVDSIISDPQAKPIGAYGCQYDHIGSIFFGDGFATWADVNKYAYVKHDYNIARDVAEGKVKVYTQKRFQEIEFVNRSITDDLDKLRFCTGQNSQTKGVYLTIKKLRDPAINNEKKSFLKTNDTIIFNPIINEFLGYAGFTPEAYSQVNLFDGSGAAFVTYFQGIPYYHPVLATKWNEYYGIAVDQMIGVCANEFPNKEKVFMAMEIQSEQKFFSPYVETDKDNYLSEITPIRVKRHGRKWNAAFMGNKNSREGLFGSIPPRGFYCKFLLIKDNTINDEYGSINNTKRTIYNEMDEIIVKFVMSESSGMTENV